MKNKANGRRQTFASAISVTLFSPSFSVPDSILPDLIRAVYIPTYNCPFEKRSIDRLEIRFIFGRDSNCVPLEYKSRA